MAQDAVTEQVVERFVDQLLSFAIYSPAVEAVSSALGIGPIKQLIVNPLFESLLTSVVESTAEFLVEPDDRGEVHFLDAGDSFSYSGDDDVSVHVVSTGGNVITSNGDDIIAGSSAADNISSSSGADTTHGGAGADTIDGGGGADLLFGGDGDDTFLNVGMGDVVDGGAGHDFLHFGFDQSTTGVVVDFLNGLGEAANWTGIEALHGHLSDHDDVMITGIQLHSLQGRSGTDLLRMDYSGALADGRTATSVDLWELGTDGYDRNEQVSLSDGSAHSFYVLAFEQFDITGTVGVDKLRGGDEGDTLRGGAGADTIDGGGGADLLFGGDGDDTLIGGEGDDILIGGDSEDDLRDVIYGGDGNDSIDGGYGNDELRGDAGDDVIAGGFGADTVIGGTGDDTLTGSAFGDQIYGGDGNDFINGGWGYDLVNGGAGADRFFHIGIADHGSDWIQDYNAAEGDVLQFGIASATRSQFQINTTHTATAAGERSGDDNVEEAFVIYRPTGQIMWALVDGGGHSSINLQIGQDVFDLMG
ncbi:MAG: calcium-binding protein [Shimia thalassica]|uniref:calcium-binding protein n=1 Tax=Shimia thalassica TaxID=1715693 RepID=UPI0032984B23